MFLHPRFCRDIKKRFQPIDIHEPMPDVEKLKINVGTAVGFVGAMMTAVFLAGGWFFGLRNVEKQLEAQHNSIGEIIALLHTTVEHNVKVDEQIAEVRRRLEVLENWDSVRTSRGIKPGNQ